MQVLTRPWGAMHYADSGPRDGLPLVFLNSLGTDLRLWDGVLPLLPPGLRVIRHDQRGHGLSDLGGEADIAALAEDVAALVAGLTARPAILVGLSIGGLIAQAVAASRPDLVRGMVLSNTAARLGTAEGWQARIAAIRAGGLAAIADAVMDRWFAPGFQASAALPLWRNMLLRTPAEGYVAACAALAAADLTAATARLRVPTLVIAGAEDGATPPGVVEATAALIPGAAFHVLPGTGHLPCVEAPAAFAALLGAFVGEHADA